MHECLCRKKNEPLSLRVQQRGGGGGGGTLPGGRGRGGEKPCSIKMKNLRGGLQCREKRSGLLFVRSKPGKQKGEKNVLN